MMALFSDMIEKTMDIFMDDFSMFRESFQICLENLEQVFDRCEETNLVLKWEKCHFMVQEGIVLGHRVSKKGIEVGKAKIEVIEKLPPPSSVRESGVFWDTLVSIEGSLKTSPRFQNHYVSCWNTTESLTLMKLV